MRTCLLFLFLAFSLSSNSQPDTSLHKTDGTISRNTGEIIQLQNKRRNKEKQAALVRIGIGAGLLVVLVIGLKRKGTKKG
jgi:hypothetical protein